MLTMLQRKEGLKSNGQYAKVSRHEIHLHLLWIIHLEMAIQNTSLVLSCKSHPKCKSKATDNCITRTLRKVNNPCTREYKHHCFPPGGNNTSPSFIFLSLKLDIRGLNPQSSIMLPLGVAIYQLAKVKYDNGEHARITQELKYKRRRTKYNTHHNLNIVS